MDMPKLLYKITLQTSPLCHSLAVRSIQETLMPESFRQSPDSHFAAVEAILQCHAAALKADGGLLPRQYLNRGNRAG
jgi:hypothetical protein